MADSLSHWVFPVITFTGNIKPDNNRLTKSAPKWSKVGKEGQGRI